MVEVIEVNDIEQLSQYRMLWNSLFPGTPKATFFHTFDWLDTYWRHFGEDRKLKVLSIFAAGAPVGILPLCVRTEHHRLGKVRVLTYPLDNWGTCYGPIGPNPASTMLAAMQHLRRTPRDWDMIELRWVPDDATQGGKTARAMRIANLFSEKQEYQSTSLVDLPRTFDEYLANKSQSLRDQFHHTLHDLFDSGRAEFIRHRPQSAANGDGDPRWDLYELCESLTQARFRSHEGVREFFRASHSAAARLGMLDLNVLTLHGKPLAFLYGYHYNANVTALRIGFDTANEKDMIAALMLHVIKDSCNRRDRSIDLGTGECEHKGQMRTRTESTYRLTYMPFDSWRSQAVRFTRWAKRRLPAPSIAVS